MKKFNWLQMVVVVLCVFSSSACRADKSDDARKKFNEITRTYQTQAQIDDLVSQLEKPQTRLYALGELVPFASLKLYRVGSIIFAGRTRLEDDLQNQAKRAVFRYTDLMSLRQMMQSDDYILQNWALWVWRGGSYQPFIDANQAKLQPDSLQARNLKINPYLSLLPLAKMFAVGNDTSLRSSAVEGLKYYEDGKKFLDERLEVETSMYVISQILYDKLNQDEFAKVIEPRLMLALRDKDETIRRDAMGFLVSALLPTSRYGYITFDNEILSEIKKLSRSTSDNERNAATFVELWWQRKLDEKATSSTRTN